VTGNWDTVFDVVGEVSITANGDDAVDGQRDLDALVELRVVGIARHAASIRIGEVELDPVGDIGKGRGAANVEAPYVGLPAGIKAVVRGSNIAAPTLDVLELCADA